MPKLIIEIALPENYAEIEKEVEEAPRPKPTIVGLVSAACAAVDRAPLVREHADHEDGDAVGVDYGDFTGMVWAYDDDHLELVKPAATWRVE